MSLYSEKATKINIVHWSKFLFVGLLLSISLMVNAQQDDQPANSTVAEQLQQLRKEVVALNRDLFVLEEDLLFPSSTQIVVYLSMDVGTYFNLDAVELQIDDKVVSYHLYTEKQIQALFKGGVQKLHIDNIGQGEHQLSAFFIGKGPQDREYKRATSLTFTKTADAKSLELSIIDSSVKQQPVFEAVEL
ncbi:hypothetical protein [Paraglaciecola arctica]|uniref:AraC family transcriptional regulator n=1 Tax=Paraglaciecola arctica BSs20135 TaxID=493475 RepID=K6YLY1_9ALTE|nr:hypothetical protein [Paraglaciecola arctica]GAC19177.1 hypothetical protein GARC_2210 [Paraglaciecola arctica BSs20135]